MALFKTLPQFKLANIAPFHPLIAPTFAIELSFHSQNKVSIQ